MKNEYHSLFITDLYDKLSTRARNGLMKVNNSYRLVSVISRYDKRGFEIIGGSTCHYVQVRTVRDLVQMTERDLLKYKNLGRKVVEEIKNVLSNMGLELGTHLDTIKII